MSEKLINLILKIRILLKITMIVILLIPFLFSLTQICLFISTRLFIFFPNIDRGWNDVFINKLPLIFQPTNHPWACMCLVILGLLPLVFIKILKKSDIESFKFNLLLLLSNIFSISFFYCIFIIPNLTILYVGKIFGIITGVSFFIFYSKNTYISPLKSNISKQKNLENQTIKQDIIEYRITDVKPFKEYVNYSVTKYINGKPEPYSNRRGKRGKLINWTCDSITIEEISGWIRTYDVNGGILNSWRKYY